VPSSRPLQERRFARFLTNPRIHWQRRSIEALRYLAPKVVEVEPLPS
jgi:hypothetical protein